MNLKSMESEQCNPPKTRGGITLKKTNWGLAGGFLQILEGDFDFDFRCICATQVIIPFPVSFVKGSILKFLKSKAPSWLLPWLKTLKGKGIFQKLKTKAREHLQKKIDIATFKVNHLLSQLQEQAERIGKLKKKWRDYENIIDTNSARLRVLRQQIQGKAELFAKNLCKHPIHGFGPWEELIQRPHPGQWPPVGPPTKPRTVKERFIRCWEIAKDLIPAQAEIKQLSKENDLLEETIKLIKKETEKNDVLLAEWQKAKRELSDLESGKSVWDGAQDEDGLDSILTKSDDIKALFWDSFFNSLVWLLEVTSIVQEKNCMSNQAGLPDGIIGASLNEETCECSVCNSPYKLCDLNSWTEYVLPNTPGTRMSDELNVCIECCDNAYPKPRFWSGGLIGNIAQEFGIPPCTCECPEEVDGKAMQWAKCEDGCERSSVNWLSDKKACREKTPPQSNCKWDSKICKWVCPSSSSSSQCPPGYRRVKKTSLLEDEECQKDCTSPEFLCEPGFCCIENPFSGGNDCLPCESSSSSSSDQENFSSSSSTQLGCCEYVPEYPCNLNIFESKYQVFDEEYTIFLSTNYYGRTCDPIKFISTQEECQNSFGSWSSCLCDSSPCDQEVFGGYKLQESNFSIMQSGKNKCAYYADCLLGYDCLNLNDCLELCGSDCSNEVLIFSSSSSSIDSSSSSIDSSSSSIDSSSSSSSSLIIDKLLILQKINLETTNLLLNKNPEDRLVYSSQNPYGGVGDAGIWVRNPNCWLNGVSNISCFSPAQRSGANWWQRGGTLITRKHVLFAKHFVTSVLPNGGTPLIFVDENNNAIRRNIINYGYDLTDIAIAVLDQEVPSNIKIAKVLPPNYTEYLKISGLDDDMILAVGLDQEEKAILKRTSFVFGSYLVSDGQGGTVNVPNIAVYNLLSTHPYYAFTENIVVGDSGNPVFIIVDNELVVLTTWWAPTSGPFITPRYDAVNAIINNLSSGEGYSLTPVDLQAVYNKLI